MKYDTSELIAAIKRNAQIPSSQVRFSNDDFLSFLNEELQLTIVGELSTLRQNYFVTTVDTSLVASTSSYAIPSYAVGWKLEGIGYVDTNSVYTELPIITRGQRDNYEGLTDATAPSAVYIMGTNVITVPDMGSSVQGSLRFDLIRIQNELVMPTNCGLISSVVDTGTAYQITVDTPPIEEGDTCDVVSTTSPFDIIARGVTASVSGSVITITYGSDFSRAPVAGDYICIEGQTPIPAIPEDYHPILALAATRRCLTAMNDTTGIQTINQELGNHIQRLRDRSSKRVANSPRKIVANNYILNMMRRRSY